MMPIIEHTIEHTTERTSAALYAIKPNPYQTRLTDDPAHVAALAEDILANSLLQVPLARPHPSGFGLELAFGHSRLAAYKLLFEQGHEDFETMPLDVRPLTDRQMSDMAAAENARRKNLTAIETATALQTRVQAFKLSQAEAGAPFGLGQSAVANLLRLLALPKEIQDMVHSGELPERLARQLAALAKIAPKEAGKVATAVAGADAGERDETLEDEMADTLRRCGQSLRAAPFDLSWPQIPIAVNEPKDGEPGALVACYGCQFRFRRAWEDHCVMPGCYKLKKAAVEREQLAAAVEKLGIPAAKDGEKAQPVMNRYDYEKHKHLAALAAAGKVDDGLGLRLIFTEQISQINEESTGFERVQLMTVNLKAVEKWLEARAPKPKAAPAANGSSVKAAAGTGKAVKVEAPEPPKETAAQKAKREAGEAAAKEAELKAQEERRRERAAELKKDADIVWVVKNFIEIGAPQLTISGHTLAYVVSRLLRGSRGQAGEYGELMDWYHGLEDAAETAKGKEADLIRRKILLASQAFEYGLPYYAGDPSIGSVVDDLADLADTTGDEPGLGIKLPAGWNKPPIHRTAYNCWHCGTFGSNRGHITQGELAAGWVVLQEQGGDIKDVTCPDCRKPTLGKPAPKAAAAKPVKKKAK